MTLLKGTAANKKLIQEVVVLVVIAIVIVGFSIVNAKPKVTAPIATKPLDTKFDNNALDSLQTKDTNYPDVTPSKSELGKPNPFAP